MASAIGAFGRFTSAKGKPDLIELLPATEGAPIEIDLSAANSSRALDDEDAEVLAEGLRDAGLWIEKVALPHHAIGDAGAASLAKLLTTAKVLDLTANRIGAQGASVIAAAMGGVTSLRLGWNPLCRKGGEAIAGAMAQPGCPLRELDLSHCDIDAAGLIAICACLRHEATAPPLEVLDLGGNKLFAEEHEDVAKQVSTCVGLNKTLKILRLRNLRFDDACAGYIADAIRVNKSLEEVDLSANRICAAGAAALAGALYDACFTARMKQQEPCPPLKILDLSRNVVGDGGAAALAEMVAADPSLTDLRVCNNGIRDEGLAALATACLEKTHLEHLGMWGNTFGPKACAAIDHLDNGDHDAFVALDVRTYCVDGKLKASRANK